MTTRRLISLQWEPAPEWFERSKCRGLGDLFFPERSNAQVDAARAVCHTCPVEKQCLEYALEKKERFGVWGGTSERERRKLQRQRRAEAERAAKAQAKRGKRQPASVPRRSQGRQRAAG